MNDSRETQMQERREYVKEAIERAFGKSREEMIAGGAFFGGPMIAAFRSGWALISMRGDGVAHYYKRIDLASVRSLCLLVRDTRWIYEPGNFPKCKRCQKLKDRGFA